jgi:hypothetical protein
MKKNLLAWKAISLMIMLVFGFSVSTFAQCRLLNESFNVNPVISPTNVDGAWYPDRYPPSAFVSNVLAGSNVLKIHIDGPGDGLLSRPSGYQYTFYNTQGRKFNQCGGCVTVSKADVWIPADWATMHRRTDMWATAFDNTNSISVYPIIGFRNPDGASPGIYYWDENVGWVNTGVVIVYNSWYNLEFRLVGPNIEYYVNGAIVGTITSNSSVYLGDIMMQAYNFNDPNLPLINQSADSYDAYWDNLITTGTGGTVVSNISTGQSFCSIQGAIDAPLTVAGNTIVVGPGTYNESVNINKSLTLKGAQADNCAYTRSGAESIINCVNGIGVNASNVTINGFTIQGQTNDNAAPGWGYAVYMAPPNTGTQLLNNIIKNNIVGSSLSNAGVSPSQVLISCNWFDSNNNPGPASGEAIYTDEFVSGGVVSNVLIDKNKFTGQDDAGINFSTSTAANASTGVTITNNDFDGNGRATFLINLVSSTFANNLIHNSNFSASGDLRLFGGVHSMMVKNNFFISGAGAVHAIRITGGAFGSNSNVTVFENSFVGYSAANTAVLILSGYTGPFNAECNWWNTTMLPAIAAQMSGSVDYTPWLLNGTDNSAAMGFQPVPNSCGGGIPKLTTSINSVIVNANNDGNDDLGSFTICNTPDNLLINYFTDQNGLNDPNLKVYQIWSSVNVTIPYCNNCSAPMAAFANHLRTASLINPSMPGTLTLKFKSWVDTNNDGIVDPTELASDWIVYTITVNAPYSCSISAVPSNNTYTGGVPTNIYLGYGPQSVTLNVTAPASGAPYTYSWSPAAGLSNTNTANPVFTATTAGSFTYTVLVTDKYGCNSTCSITICVRDIRVPGTSGNNLKVYLCHVPPGNPANAQTLSLSVNAVPSHLANHSGDRLGKCDQLPCSSSGRQEFVEQVIKPDVDALTVKAMPNPSSGYFLVSIESNDKTPVTVKVMNGLGQIIETNQGITPGSIIQIGENFKSGVYYLHVLQGNSKKVIKLMKLN